LENGSALARTKLTALDVLDELYEGATNPAHWARFLEQLALLFNSPTASLRVTDVSAPVVLDSCTVGFDAAADQCYTQQLVEGDPFRQALAEGPLGVIQASHLIIPDRAYERTQHYQQVFRPNGNFYAMGAQIERSGQRAAHIGVHRARELGPYSAQEQRQLQFFSPHLRRAVRLMRLLGEFELALNQARAALDQLPYGVWLVNHQLKCLWMNGVAEDAVRTGLFGLALNADHLSLADADEANQLRGALVAINRKSSKAETVPLGQSGASLVLVNSRVPALAHNLSGSADNTLLVFLLNPEQAITPDAARLRKLYGLTPAEIHLVGALLRGLDASEASAWLGLSIHTARSQLKSAMQKMGVKRQAELMRKLLLTTTSLCPGPV
jgi:DNA-binding CsgD family transcriptional regulator/PAS domain-containing protein